MFDFSRELGFLSIEWTSYGQSTALKHVSIDHSGLHIFVTEQFLHSSDVIAVLEEVSGEGIPKGRLRTVEMYVG